jgi:TonB family protein
MPSNKILILSLAVSIISHALILWATGLMSIGGGSPINDKTIFVDLQKHEYPDPDKAEDVMKEKNPSPAVSVEAASYDDVAEETIALDSSDKKYAPYLKKIKTRIERVWTYPRPAFAQKKEGISTIKFSINKKGRLLGSSIVNSSGYEPLDREAVNAITASAPYEPFPGELKLSRLHIMASFHYRLIK